MPEIDCFGALDEIGGTAYLNITQDKDCPVAEDGVDRAAKLNGTPANVAVIVEEAAASTKIWTRWRRLQSRLELTKRVRERLSASEWWRRRRRRKCDCDELPTTLPRKPNLNDSKSFPDRNGVTDCPDNCTIVWNIFV